jgi:hypothetical protein
MRMLQLLDDAALKKDPDVVPGRLGDLDLLGGGSLCAEHVKKRCALRLLRKRQCLYLQREIERLEAEEREEDGATQAVAFAGSSAEEVEMRHLQPAGGFQLQMPAQHLRWCPQAKLLLVCGEEVQLWRSFGPRWKLHRSLPVGHSRLSCFVAARWLLLVGATNTQVRLLLASN